MLLMIITNFRYKRNTVLCLVTQWYPTLFNPRDCSPPGSSVQARILEWVAISSPRGSSQPKDQTCTPAGRFFTTQPPGKPMCISAAAAKSLQSCPTLCNPTRSHRPWDSPGNNTGVGCHFLLQCMKVKSESEACPTLSDPMDCSLPGSSLTCLPYLWCFHLQMSY